MSEELKAAAERIAEHVRSNGLNTISLDGLRTLARAYLLDHPADDGEPVTEEWLRSVGSEPLDGVAQHAWKLGLFVNLAIQVDGSIVLNVDRFRATLKRGIATRADVRLLCKALGIPLKEVSVSS